MATLEQYYTGGAYLGPGNAVSDFSPVVCSAYFLVGAIGHGAITTEIWGGWKVNDVVGIVATAIFTAFFIVK